MVSQPNGFSAMSSPRTANWLLALGAGGFLLLSVLTLWAGPNSVARIEGDLTEAAQTRLAEGGFDWASARAVGQRIVLEGVAPTDEEKASAVAAVRATEGVTRVAARKLEVAATVSPYTLTARKDPAGPVIIGGHAPNRQSLHAIADAASAFFGDTAKLDVRLASGAPKQVDWTIAAVQGFDALAHLDSGEISLNDASLHVVGTASTEEMVDAVRDKLARPGGGVSVDLDVMGPPEWTARMQGERLVFTGHVATRWMQQALIAASRVPTRLIEDRSTVGDVGPWQRRALAALPHLAVFKSGAIEVQGETFRISGEARGSVQEYLREDMARIVDRYAVDMQVVEVVPAMAELDGLDLNSPLTKRANCNEAFKRVLAANRIVFTGRTARLDRASGLALDKAVELARRCPEFALEIQGHTDDIGRRSENMRLSRQRAEVVKAWMEDRGVRGERLAVAGLGPDRPLAANRNERGRADNRRIEIRVSGE